MNDVKAREQDVQQHEEVEKDALCDHQVWVVAHPQKYADHDDQAGNTHHAEQQPTHEMVVVKAAGYHHFSGILKEKIRLARLKICDAVATHQSKDCGKVQKYQREFTWHFH